MRTVDHVSCYPAVERDDPRFDGQFFTAVLTTGIYCRSVCKAQTPRPENVRFFATAAAAAESGFRPCLRCRPESAPDQPPWQSISPVVSRALRLIGDGLLNEHGTEELARRLNVSGRHLQRLFLDELGTPPVAVAQTRRLLFAKKLIDETNLSMTNIAFTAGYRSVRRFNEAIRQTYGRTPTVIRSKRRRSIASAADCTVELRLFYREPYHWPAMLEYLERHATSFVERVENGRYRRTIQFHGTAGVIEVQPLDNVNAILLRVPASLARHLLPISERVKQMFDLSADTAAISEHLSSVPELRPSVNEHPGMRIPGTWDGHELTLRALLNTHLGFEQGLLAAGLLVEWFGDELANQADPELSRLFPRPEQVVDAPLSRIGMPPLLEEAIRSVSRMCGNGALAFDGSMSPEAVLSALTSIPGIDDGLARYIRVRALALPDEAVDFSPGDSSLTSLAGSCSPWNSYAAMYHWAASRLIPA